MCISNTIGTNDLLGFARTGSKDINDFTEGIFACDLKSLSLHVIMHVLFPAAFIVLLRSGLLTDSWRENRAYLMRMKAN